ncbi:PREDICTED: uncharacterized protein LOC104608881 isoform X2 [Nelumbo nucifera]|uniref:Uncharacterized protein LOC104608881 isoform X2 n=1 Tax=Nelumbo nucifera TaxID=4432 RepID=A0A1U8BAY0_NELNU|nr:PREDICTED: uncharacterized protein LOC104608881 isoform X2 [Nelumbo nucifera]
MRSKCRIWWPKQLSSCEPKPTIWFGWFVHSSWTSINVVVALAASPNEISRSCFQSGLQEILHYTNSRMPLSLQEKSTFSILGYCAMDCSFSEQLQGIEIEDVGTKSNNCEKLYPEKSQDLFGENHGRSSCECHKYRFFEQSNMVSIGINNWIQLSYDSHEYHCRKIHGIPKLHHIHWSKRIVYNCDLHVFEMQSKRPKCIDELCQKQALPDLDIVVLAINCATAANNSFERCMGCKTPLNWLFAMTCSSIAMFVASFFTLFYTILQIFHAFLSYGSHSLIYKILAKVFSHTWKNVHIRSCQLLYWPIFLQEGGFRSQSNVQYAERYSLRKHSMWSSIAIDLLLGNMVGVALLIHAEAVSLWVSNLVHNITNTVLRLGCVWLMGVPAGFKLNMELARGLGLISLNVIHMWSTLWFFVGFFFSYFLKVLSISGIILGTTVSASLIKDMIVMATSHVSTLHWLISLLYSQQIQALAALWRLFRGRKWNPLRRRLDSYDYTVEQHIVGSLLFTPLLLLLPTTSVFYIFFTIMNTTSSCICILIEVIVSILHATPYAKIFIWMVRPRRFPCGIWFEILTDPGSKVLGHPEVGYIDEDHPGCGKTPEDGTKQEDEKRYAIMISFLRSNFSNIGQIILPHYRVLFHGVSLSSGASPAYGLFTGRSSLSRVSCLPNSAMARKPSTLMLCVLTILLVLLREIQGSIIATKTEAPAAEPQPATLNMYGATQGSLHPQECAPRCTARCSATAYKKPCMFFCQKCCAECLCVPPGTYGNKQFCPCYNNWKTKRGGPKCP